VQPKHDILHQPPLHDIPAAAGHDRLDAAAVLIQVPAQGWKVSIYGYEGDTVTEILKCKRVHLTGKKLRELNEHIFARDRSCCVVCGRWVDPGTKFHHEPCGTRKSDEMEHGVVLCNQCHYDRHFSGRCNEIKEKIQEYLFDLYR